MKILIIHQVPYQKMDYARALDHSMHEVTYIGYASRMSDLPEDLICNRIILNGERNIAKAIIEKTNRKMDFEKVLALSEFGILQAYHVRQHLGIHGPALEELERVRDKVRMKEAISRAGIRHPRFVETLDPGKTLPWRGKTVLKPRQGASSEGVLIFNTADDAVEHYRQMNHQDEYQIEEFIEGNILHADGLVDGGKIINLVVSRYINKPLEYANGSPLGSYQLPSTKHYRTFADNTVKAVGITEGCIHLEFFEPPEGELIFLEIANRLGGGGIVHSHLRHTGIHLPSAEMAIRLGLSQPVPSQPTGRYHGWLFFPGHHLTPKTPHAITISPKILAHRCLDKIHILGPNRPLPNEITYQEWEVPVFIEASHADHGVLGNFLKNCVDRVFINEGRT